MQDPNSKPGAPEPGRKMPAFERVVLGLTVAIFLIGATSASIYNVVERGGAYFNASTGNKTNEAGDISMVDADRDRNYPILLPLMAAISVPPGGSVISPAMPIEEFTRSAVMLNYSYPAAADSDSVAIGVRVWGKTSTTSGNRYLWTPYTGYKTSLDTVWSGKTIADSAGAAGAAPTPMFSFFVVRGANGQRFLTTDATKVPATIYGGTITTRTTLRRIPVWAFRWAGYNGVMLTLSDDSGNPCPFPVIEVEFFNLSYGKAISSLQADLWTRVN